MNAAAPESVKAQAACANCGAGLSGEWCASCGQKRIHAGDLSFGHALHHLFHEVVHLDGRLWNTLRLLLTRPGQLSLDFLEGRRQRHLHPARVYLVTLAFSFFLANTTYLRLAHIEERAPRVAPYFEAKARQAGLTKAQYLHDRDPVLQATYKAAVMASIVASTGLLLLLFRRRFHGVGEHLTVAAHNASAGFVFTVPVGWAMVLLPYAAAPLVATGVVAAVYTFFACRRVYGESRLATALKVLLLVAITESAWHFLAMGFAFRRATN